MTVGRPLMSSLPKDQRIGSPTLNQFSGPLLLAATFNWGLFGVLTVQVYFQDMYALAPFSQDTKFVKSIVYGVYLLEVIQSILILYDAIRIFVCGFLDANSLLLVSTIWISLPILTGLVTFICQGLFAYRIWVLGKHRIFKVAFTIIAVTGIVQIAASFSLAVLLKDVDNFRLIVTEGKRLIFASIASIWVVASVIGDILIALCMISLLSAMYTDVPQTLDILQRLIRLTAGTGSMTAAVSVISLVIMLALPTKSYYKTSLATLGKMYSNCMMVMLNSRMKLADSEKPDQQKQELAHMEFGSGI